MIRKVAISLHDTSPAFLKETEVVLRTITQKKSFLITPLWHGKVGLDHHFSELVKPEDLVLHGYRHISSCFDPYSIVYGDKNISREFLNLDLEATKRLIGFGKKLFEDHLGRSPKGFIPPMWYHNKHMPIALKELGFEYTESWTEFFNLTNSKKYYSFPLSLDYGRNTLLSSLYLSAWRKYLKWKQPELIRIAIHPSDIGNGLLPKIRGVIQLLEEQGHKFVTYSELFDDTQL